MALEMKGALIRSINEIIRRRNGLAMIQIPIYLSGSWWIATIIFKRFRTYIPLLRFMIYIKRTKALTSKFTGFFR